MVRAKKKSEIIDQTRSRLAGMKSINEKLDLGHGCSTATVEAKLNEAVKALEVLNKLKSQTSEASNEFERIEKELGRLSKQILLGAAMKYDQDSSEYEMVGGVRLSDRKRSKAKPAIPVMA